MIQYRFISILYILVFVHFSAADQQRHYESEHLFANLQCDSIIYDITASNDSCRVAYVETHSSGHMQFGPYDTIPPGFYISKFRLKKGYQSPHFSPACSLDIISGYPDITYHAIQNLYTNSFSTPDTWQDFALHFYLQDTVSNFETRVWWHENIDIYADCVDIEPFGRYESEHLFANPQCNHKIYDPSARNDSCRVAYSSTDSCGYMQFGPYDTMPPGHYIALFRIKRGDGYIGYSPLCELDIMSDHPVMKCHAIQVIYPYNFDSVDTWQNFRLYFYLPDTVNYFQTRIYWFSVENLYADYTDIEPVSELENILFAVNLMDPDLNGIEDTIDYYIADYRILLGSIQGGVNRDTARLVFVHNHDHYEGQGIYRWLAAFDIPYALITLEECIDNLVRSEYFKGCVLFDPGVLDETAIEDPPEHQRLLLQIKAIATNLAALDSLLIVTPRVLDSNLIDTADFPVKYDLTDTKKFSFLTDSTGESALLYNLSLFDTCNFNKDIIFKLFPYRSMESYVNAAEKLTDYTIQNRYWCFYKYIKNNDTVDFFENARFDSTHYLMGWADQWMENGDLKCNEYTQLKLSSEAGKLWIGKAGSVPFEVVFKELQDKMEKMEYLMDQKAHVLKLLEMQIEQEKIKNKLNSK